MPNDAWHKHWGFAALAALTVFLCMEHPEQLAGIALLDAGFIFGLFWLNPDVDTNSASRNAWGPLKFIWKNRLYHFSHRGIMHNPLLWIVPCVAIAAAWNLGYVEPVYVLTTCGVVLNALLHLAADTVMDRMHSSKLPVLKDI